MTYKTILVVCDGSGAAAGRIEIAADLARRFDAHLVGLHVQPPFEAPAMIEGGFGMGAFYEAYETRAREDREAAAGAFRKAMAKVAVSYAWRTAEGEMAEVVSTHARYADLVVLGQNSDDLESLAPDDLAEAVALSTGRAVLVAPYTGVRRQPGKTVMLCWNASREAARAATDALPLLKAADRVVVLTIDAKTSASGHGPEPGADAAAWLARHGVKVTVQRDTAADSDVGATILSRAADLDADLIVMGVYGHSRLRELVLGGASRTLLGSMTVPVLMAH